MKRIYLIIGLVLIASLCFAGRIQQHHMMIIGQEQAAAGGPSEVFSDDFTADITGWTTIAGEWSHDAGNGQIDCDSAFGYHGIYYSTTALTDVDGWIKVQLVNGVSGVAFRISAVDANYYALVEYYGDQFAILWVLNQGSVIETLKDANEAIGDGIGGNEYLGVTWTGTGNDLVVRCWDNPSNAAPDSVSSWDSGAADYTISGLTISNPCDTGKYVGLTSNAGHDFDNYSAGDL